MGFDQGFECLDMISSSRSFSIFKEKSLENNSPSVCYEIGINWNILYRNASNRKKRKIAITKRSKRKVNEVQALIIPSRIYGEKLDVDVNKKGGEISLMGGSKITVEENTFIKKSTISSYIIPPNKRQYFPITLQYQEVLISEIFLIFSKVFLKKPITYFIPSLTKTNRYCYLISCTTNQFQWISNSKFEFDEEGMTFSTDKWGYFAIIGRQPFENIYISSNGGLFNTRIHPMVSLRIPKNSCPINNVCSLQYLQYSDTIIEKMIECYPSELSHMLKASSMISFEFPPVQFKRHITIKLPLPEWAADFYENNSKNAELMVLCKRQGSWEHVESRIHYTKNTFTFESNVFGTFILVEPRSNREGKIRHSLSRLEYVNNIVKGIILVFIFFESKSWYIWVELVSLDKAAAVRALREEGGLVFIQQFIPPSFEKSDKATNAQYRRSTFIPNTDCSRIVELSDGMIFTMTLEGDVQFKENTTHNHIISKAVHKTIEAILKKQTPVSSSNQRKSLGLISNADEPIEDDFLMNLGKKTNVLLETEITTSITDANFSINTSRNESIIYYALLEENYRIIEIEPKKVINLEEVHHKWIQKELIKSTHLANENQQHLSENGEDLFGKTNTFSESSELHGGFEDIVLENTVFQSQSEMSKKRTEIVCPEEIQYSFNGILKVTRDISCFQLPPNQLKPEYEVQNSINSENKLIHLQNYLPSNVFKSEYKYKFFMEPEEIREYLGFTKPTSIQLNKAKQDKAESLVNTYLKDVNLVGVDAKVLEQTKKNTLKNMVYTHVGISDVVTNIEVSARLSKTNKTDDVQHRVSDRTNVSEMYREPKILSGRSLKALSQYVEHGLTLAVHLNLPDSVITGIGYDSLSANQTLAEVTYKVLIHWKQATNPDSRSKMVTQLVNSLRILGLNYIADTVQNAGNNNEELTKEHFLRIPDYNTRTLSSNHVKFVKESKLDEKELNTKTKNTEPPNRDVQSNTDSETYISTEIIETQDM